MNQNNNKEEQKFVVEVLGENHVVVGDLSRDYLEELADKVNQIGEEISQAYPNIPRRQLVRLTLLNLADQWIKAQEDKEKIIAEKEELQTENKELQEEIDYLRQDNEELMELLQEVD